MVAPIAALKRKSLHKLSLVFDALGLGVPLAALVLFIFIPFFFVLFLAIGETSDGFINAIKTILEGSLYHKIFRFTLLQAGISTGLSLLIGIPVGYIFGRFEFVGRKILLALVTVPFILPPLYVVLGFIRFWGSAGFVNNFLAIFGVDLGLDLSRGFWAIIMAHAFYNAPLVIYWVSSALAILDKDQIDAARTLGSKNLHFFRRILLPNMLPGLLAASILTFTYCLLSFAIVLELGGGQFYTIELQIWILYKPPFSLR
ncbi:MAG: ABC transporter permease, partial [Candidatus Hodarchaeota archaeon]